MSKASRTCRACRTGSLARRARSRGAGAQVAGWLLVLVGLAGVAVAAIGGTGATVDATAKESHPTRLARLEAELGPRFDAVDLPRAYLEDIAADREPMTSAEVQALTEEQRRVYGEAKAEALADRFGLHDGGILSTSFASVGAAFFAALALVAIASAALGLFLVKPRSVLQCTSCGAVSR